MQAAIAEARSTAKYTKYLDLCSVLSALNVPFTLETYGALSRSAAELLSRFVSAYAELPNTPLTPAAFSVLVRQRVSIALQKGNALVEAQGLRRARMASFGQHAPGA